MPLVNLRSFIYSILVKTAQNVTAMDDRAAPPDADFAVRPKRILLKAIGIVSLQQLYWCLGISR